MLLKSLPLLGALLGFLVPGASVSSAPNLDMPMVYFDVDLDCMCMSDIRRNVQTAAPKCPQQGTKGIVFVPCFFTQYVFQGAGENGECPEKATCISRPCFFPDIQLILNWQHEAVIPNEGCYDSDDCCSTGVGYAGSMYLQPPNDVMNGAGSYKYMPWRRNITADCGEEALADWAGLKCDGRSEHDPWDYYEEFWFQCNPCPANPN
jgi:hypothetical protein